MKRKREADDHKQNGMKLRSGKVVDPKVRKLQKELNEPLDVDKIVIPTKVKAEIIGVMERLKSILKGNEQFASLLIEKSLLLGKDNDDPGKVVFRDTIHKLIKAEYPDVHLSKEGEDEDLLSVAYDLGSLIYGNHKLVREDFITQPKSKWGAYRDILRNKIEKEVCDIFNAPKQEEVEVMGSSALTASNLDIDE